MKLLAFLLVGCAAAWTLKQCSNGSLCTCDTDDDCPREMTCVAARMPWQDMPEQKLCMFRIVEVTDRPSLDILVDDLVSLVRDRPWLRWAFENSALALFMVLQFLVTWFDI